MGDRPESGSTASKPRARWLFPALAAALAAGVLVASQLPLAWAMRAQQRQYRPDLVFTGTLPLYLDDANADWSFMRQAARGRLGMTDLYTVDEQPGNYVNSLFAPLGAIAGGLSVDVVPVYNVAKVVLGALLLAMLYLLAARLFEAPGERLACFFLFLLSGGWEGPIAFLQRHAGVGWSASSPGWWMPEIGTLFSLMLFPHLTAGLAAMIASFLLMLRAWRPGDAAPRERAGWAAAAGGVLFVLTLFHPYDTVTALGTIATATLAIGLAERRWPRVEAAQTAIAAAVAAPAVAYDLYLVATNPAIRAWHLQNVMPTPSPGELFFCFGVNAVLALAVVPRFRAMTRPQLVMLAWLVSALVLVHLPFRFQRRMMGGLQIPIAALACLALARYAAPDLAGAWRALRKRSARDRLGWGTVALVALLAPLNVVTPCYVHQEQWRAVRTLSYPSWLGVEESEALRALDAMAPGGARAIAAYETANFIPARSGVATYFGHPALTVDAKARGADVARFYGAGPEDDPWRRELLRRWKIEFVLYTPRERALGSFDPGTRPWLREVFVTGDDPARRAAIYRLQ